jgi:hypothetical protein
MTVSNDGLDPGGRLGRVAVAPAAVVAHRLALEPRLLAHLLKLLDARVTAVGAARSEQLLDDFAMTIGALKLADRLAIPVEAEPFEPVENRVHRSLCRTLAIGVFDAQQELAAEALGVEPVEQSRARAADMQKACRRRREAGDDVRHFAGSSKRAIWVESVPLAEAGALAKARPHRRGQGTAPTSSARLRSAYAKPAPLPRSQTPPAPNSL